MLTAAFGEIEDIVDGELPSFSFFELPAADRAGLLFLTLALCFLFWQIFPGHSDAANRDIEADREG